MAFYQPGDKGLYQSIGTAVALWQLGKTASKMWGGKPGGNNGVSRRPQGFTPWPTKWGSKGRGRGRSRGMWTKRRYGLRKTYTRRRSRYRY